MYEGLKKDIESSDLIILFFKSFRKNGIGQTYTLASLVRESSMKQKN